MKDQDTSAYLDMWWTVQAWTQIGETDPQGESNLKLKAPDTRCDAAYYLSTGPAPVGCVFPGYTPFYIFNTAKAPAAAAHAWLMQEKLPTHPGDVKTPLRYLPKANRNLNSYDPDRSRNVICPTGWAAKFGNPNATPYTVRNPDDVASCDEYAFAATYQSAGMPADLGGTQPVGEGKGDECVQTYATKNSDGTWHLYDDERVSLPTWDEKCGRSAISSWVNSTAMARIPTFVKTFRMLDEDSYSVIAPGFENCDPSTASVVCAFKPYNPS
jgi:hypothetical protein